MSDNIFRSKVSESVAEPTPQVEKKDVSTGQITDVEAPFTDYQKMNNHPYLVDHFKLGDTWKDKLGGFEKEVTAIEDYFKDKIEQGQMQNTSEAVRGKLKEIYKLCNIESTERTTMQIEKLAAYIEFLRKTDNIQFNHYKYR